MVQIKKIKTLNNRQTNLHIHNILRKENNRIQIDTLTHQLPRKSLLKKMIRRAHSKELKMLRYLKACAMIIHQ